MNSQAVKLLFALIRVAIFDKKITEEEKNEASPEFLNEAFLIAKKHDVSHMVAQGMVESGLVQSDNTVITSDLYKAIYRYQQINYEYTRICSSLECGKIAFLPLKGAVIRKYYAKPWMRTSCDIDILVHKDDLANAIAHLSNTLNYTEKEKTGHDVSLYSASGVHIELHFDLVEEGRANDAESILRTVWQNVVLKDGCAYHYEMSDEFLYFYHIAHMAKHFESGGCGIRPLIDLFILDNIKDGDWKKRDELLERGELLTFTEVCRSLSRYWFDFGEPSDLVLKLQDFLLNGGVYGTTDNRVALQQKKRGGRIGFFFSRIFIPYQKLRRYYPVLEKHPWLMPIMQIRRWFLLFRPDVAWTARRELQINQSLDEAKAEEMNRFRSDLGIK